MDLRRSSDAEEEIPFLLPEQPNVANKLKTDGENIHKFMYMGASVFMLIVSFALVVAGSRHPTDAQCTKKMSTWSPLLEAVEYEWRPFKEEEPNPYYGKPTEQLEKAWGLLWEYGSAGIPDSKLHLLNKSSTVDWKHLPDELGGGVEAYFEGFHQVHCVDLLRQFTYRDEYDYSDNPAFVRQPDVLYDHADHCIEVLRINIMCAVDVTPYLIEERGNGENMVRTDGLYHCRKFDKMVERAEEIIIHPYNATAERLKAIKEVNLQSGHDEHDHRA